MKFRKQVLMAMWSLAWVITVDGALVRRKQDVTKEFSHTVVDKTANSLVFVERDLMFHDKGLAYAFEEDKSLDDTVNEIPKEEETSRFAKGLKRPKRQYGDAEQLEGSRDPKMDELHSIWNGVWGAMVDGAEKFLSVIKEKMAGGQNPGQQQYSDSEI